MKTKSLIYRIGTAAMMSAGFLMSAPLLSSCSSDDTPQVEESDPNAAPTLSLTLSTPFLSGLTRAAMTRSGETPSAPDVTEAEAHINSLWVYIFSVDKEAGTSSLWQAINIETSTHSSTGAKLTLPTNVKGAAYHEVISGLNIPAGDYRIYVMANLDNYQSSDNEINPDELGDLDKDAKAAFEAKLKSYNLVDVASGENSILSLDEALPMAAGPGADITAEGTGVETKDGIFTIKAGSVTVKADMTFLCSAVRYTFLFDNTAPTELDSEGYANAGFSYPLQSFEVTGLKLSKIKSVTPLYTTTATSFVENPATLTGSRCVYPSDYTSFVNQPDYLTEDQTAWPATSKVAYQGKVYIPENLATEKDGKTTMTLTVKEDGKDKTYTIALPNNNNENCDENVGHNTATNGENVLMRGHFYDIIGRVTSEGMAFYVKINPWVKAKRDIFEI